MTKEHIEQEAIEYLKKHKQTFFAHYLQNLNPLEEKAAFFTAGPSGAGKTEFAQSLLEIDTNLLHLDIDSVREFFAPIGYDGSNSDVYQKPAGRGVQMLFDDKITLTLIDKRTDTLYDNVSCHDFLNILSK